MRAASSSFTRPLLVLTLAIAALSTLFGRTDRAVAADTRAYPRTYHIWSCRSADDARYDMVVGFGSCDIARMRSLNPNGIFLLQPGLDVGTSSYNNIHVVYGAADKWKRTVCDSIKDGSAANLGCIRSFDPAWDYLWNANGSIASANATYRSDGWNLADPRSKGTPTLIAKLIAYAAKQRKLYRNGWDGIHSDNWVFGSIGASWMYGPSLDTDRDGTVDDQTVLRRNWDTGLTNLGHLLRSYLPGKIVGGNGNWYKSELYSGSERDGWLRSANYTLIEHFERHGHYNDPGLFVRRARQWLDYPDPRQQTRYLAVLQDALKCDNTELIIPKGSDPNQDRYKLDPCVMKSMRWGLTLSLLSDVYYKVYPYPNHGARWWYDEYDGGVGVRRRGYLGRPVNDPHKLANGVWRRDFDNGITLNNSTGSTQSVALGSTYRHLLGEQNPGLNDGSSTEQVSIPSHDGVILLRGSKLPAAPAGQLSVRSMNLVEGQTVRGEVRWEAEVAGGTASKVEFSIDGRLRWTEGTPPYLFNGGAAGRWNAAGERNGRHTLTVRAFAKDGKTTASTIHVRVLGGLPAAKITALRPRIAGTRASTKRHRVLVRVWVARCQPCQARLRLQIGRRVRVVAMRPAPHALLGVVRNVPSGRWRYRVVLVDRDSGRRTISRWRAVRVP